jgi:B12 binding domain
MHISLATSLHLNHGARPLDARGGEPLTMMQAFVPVGLLSLKAACTIACPAASIKVVEINTLLNAGMVANDDDFYELLAETILRNGDDVVGLMTDSDSLHHTIAIARRVKAKTPRALVGLGGPAASPVARKILERFSAVDFIVRGEGEETFAEYVSALAAGVPPHNIAGLTCRKGADIEHYLACASSS